MDVCVCIYIYIYICLRVQHWPPLEVIGCHIGNRGVDKPVFCSAGVATAVCAMDARRATQVRMTQQDMTNQRSTTANNIFHAWKLHFKQHTIHESHK